MTTIKDVAAKAGVSISTVSFVLNGKAKDKRVAEDTCRKVLEAAAALGYQPNCIGQKASFRPGGETGHRLLLALGRQNQLPLRYSKRTARGNRTVELQL